MPNIQYSSLIHATSYKIGFEYPDNDRLQPICVPKPLLENFSAKFSEVMRTHPDNVQWNIVFPNEKWNIRGCYYRDYIWNGLGDFVVWLYKGNFGLECNFNPCRFWLLGALIEAPIFQNSVLRHFCENSDDYVDLLTMETEDLDLNELAADPRTYPLLKFIFDVAIYNGTFVEERKKIVRGGGACAELLVEVLEDIAASGPRQTPWSEERMKRYLVATD